jgi:hypothetical protein
VSPNLFRLESSQILHFILYRRKWPQLLQEFSQPAGDEDGESGQEQSQAVDAPDFAPFQRRGWRQARKNQDAHQSAGEKPAGGVVAFQVGQGRAPKAKEKRRRP